MNFYTGIGSRQTPPDILALMSKIARVLERKDFILRSGGAEGADTHFEIACDAKVIYLPWSGFNGRSGPHTAVCGDNQELREIAAQFHPFWSGLKEGAKKLHTRNVAQVLGEDGQTPSEFVIYWTDPSKRSGTDQAVRIAKAYSIPTFNLYEHREKFEKRVKELYETI